MESEQSDLAPVEPRRTAGINIAGDLSSLVL